MPAATSLGLDARALHGLGRWAAAATVLLLPLASGRVIWSTVEGATDFNLRVSVSPFDVALLLVVALAGLDWSRAGGQISVRTWPVAGQAALALVAVLGVAFVAHPSWRGVDWAYRVVAAGALAWFVARRDDRAIVVPAVVLGVATAQAVLAAAQFGRGEAVGLGVLEFDGPLYPFGSDFAGRGGLDHPYHLTALLMVGLGAALVIAGKPGLTPTARSAVVAATAVVGFGVAVTYSRAAVLALVPIVVLGIATFQRAVVAVVVAAALGFGGGAAVGWDGWVGEGERSVETESVDSGRVERVEEAFRLLEENPVLGVGPGRYVIALRDVEHTRLLPPHNFGLHAVAEGGPTAGFAALVAFAAFGWLALRSGLIASAVWLTLVPFHVLDSYPHVFPTGMVVTGLWIGLVLHEMPAADD